MQLKIKAAVLTKMVSEACDAIPANTTEPVYKNFLLKVDQTENGSSVEILASDGTVTLKSVLSQGDEKDPDIIEVQPGSLQVPAKMLVDMTRGLEGSIITLTTVDTSLLRVSDEGTSYNINTSAADEYPDVYMDFDESKAVKVGFSDFVRLYQSTSFATAVKGMKQCFTGINVRIENGRLYFLATDACRLAQMSVAIDTDQNLRFTVPSKVLQMICKNDGAKEVWFELGENKALFKAGNTVYQSRLYTGDFPSLEKITPKNTPFLLTVNSEELLTALNQVALVSGTSSIPVAKLTCASDSVELVSSYQGNTAKANLKKFTFEGDLLVISFNIKYVTEAIKALNAPKVTLAFAGESRIFLVQSDDPYNNQIVTPIRTM